MQSQLRLLCIDDEELGLRIRKAVFEHAGYDVRAAHTAQDAIELFQSQHFDAVVLDYLMPDANGGTVAAALKAIHPHVPILLLSAYAGIPQETLQLVDAHLPKGSPPQELLRKLKSILVKSGQ